MSQNSSSQRPLFRPNISLSKKRKRVVQERGFDEMEGFEGLHGEVGSGSMMNVMREEFLHKGDTSERHQDDERVTSATDDWLDRLTQYDAPSTQTPSVIPAEEAFMHRIQEQFAYEDEDESNDGEDPYDMPPSDDPEKERQVQMDRCLEDLAEAVQMTVPLAFPYRFKISNLVLAVHFSGGLSLSKLYTRLKNAELKSDTELHFQFATSYGRLVCIIRKSGKLTVTGSRTVKEALHVARFVAALAEKFNIVEKNTLPTLQIRHCRLVNIVAGMDLHDSVRLDHLQQIIRHDLDRKQHETRRVAQGIQESLTKAFYIENVVYEPEVFAGLKVIFTGNVILQLFANGRLQMMGATKMQQLYDYCEYLMPMLRQSMGAGRSEENAIVID